MSCSQQQHCVFYARLSSWWSVREKATAAGKFQAFQINLMHHQMSSAGMCWGWMLDPQGKNPNGSKILQILRDLDQDLPCLFSWHSMTVWSMPMIQVLVPTDAMDASTGTVLGTAGLPSWSSCQENDQNGWEPGQNSKKQPTTNYNFQSEAWSWSIPSLTGPLNQKHCQNLWENLENQELICGNLLQTLPWKRQLILQIHTVICLRIPCHPLLNGCWVLLKEKTHVKWDWKHQFHLGLEE